MREEEICVYDRRAKAQVPVQTAAAKWMRTLYDTRPGNLLLWALIKRKCVSALYGRYCRTRRSKRAAQQLIEQYGLDMSEYPPFETYRDFFIRQKREVAFPPGDGLGAVAESFLTAWEHIDPARLYQVKDSTYSWRAFWATSRRRRRTREARCCAFAWRRTTIITCTCLTRPR